MRTLARSAVVLFALFLPGGLAGSAEGHGVLLESTPRSGQKVALGVSQVDLRFSSRVERAFSSLRLTGPSGENVPLKPDPSEAPGPNRLRASLPTLGPGRYTVHWRILSVDGRVSDGRFSFELAERR